MNERLCDTCVKADVCKYKGDVMKNKNEILAGIVTGMFCLKVTFSCEKWERKEGYACLNTVSNRGGVV